MKPLVYWLQKARPRVLPPLTDDAEHEAVVVGGGMAGLSAAQWLIEEAGLRDVALLEAHFCGSGATGISAGLLNPDTELDADRFCHRYGDAGARALMRAAHAGIDEIRTTIERHGIACDFLAADALYVADSRMLVPEIRREHAARRRLGLEARYYARTELGRVLGTERYFAGLRFGGTFGMSGGEYVRGLRDALLARGLHVYENSPALAVAPHEVRAPGGRVRARHVFACVDRFAPTLGVEARDVYQQQNFIVVSEPLEAGLREALFPDGPLLVYDTRMVFHYFRLTPDGRLVLGGGLGRKAYRTQPSDPRPAARHLVRYLRKTFPRLGDLRFTHAWSGFFGLARDLMPIAGKVPGGLHVALCGGGMTWSLLAGKTAAQVALEGSAPLASFFAPRRAFTPIDPLTAPLPKPVGFQLSNMFAKVQKGPPAQIARKQRCVRMTACALAAGLAAWALARQART